MCIRHTNHSNCSSNDDNDHDNNFSSSRFVFGILGVWGIQCVLRYLDDESQRVGGRLEFQSQQLQVASSAQDSRGP